jgi:hypothetical protein
VNSAFNALTVAKKNQARKRAKSGLNASVDVPNVIQRENKSNTALSVKNSGLKMT